MSTINPDSPCKVGIMPDDKGGIYVSVNVPTYQGMYPLDILVERDGDGDWRVTLPNLADMEVCNGILYMGAPDVERPAKWEDLS